jgi:hypothetical protein
VDHTFTVFPDGMTRCDRTTTFLSSVLVSDYFEWMSSHDTTSPFLGRIGRGLTVHGEVDTHPKVATPATPTSSTSTTGGVLTAATYSYRVAALSDYGETVPSPAKTQTTTGTTSTVTVGWSTVTNATGYRIYGRTAGVERLLATVRAGATSWIDDGNNAPTDPPLVYSTARLYNSTTSPDAAFSTQARWAVWLEPRSGWCMGNIYDSESALARTGVSEVRSRLESASGIQKSYANIYWSSGDNYTIPNGEVYTATHWTYVYLPEDKDRWHTEIAYRAANFGALPGIYPNT